MKSIVPTKAITSPSEHNIHRFYDTSPISPSGRFLATTALPYVHKLPVPGDMAAVNVWEIETGQLIYSAPTGAWDTQVGAHAQWGATDRDLFFNDLCVETWRPFSRSIDIFDGGSAKRLPLTVYMLCPAGESALTPNLQKLGLLQSGYGINVPNREIYRHLGAPKDDGVFVLDVNTGHYKLLVSLDDIAGLLNERGQLPDLLKGGLYCFHLKWNAKGSRIMAIVRYLRADKSQGSTQNYLVTMDSDGGNLKLALGSRRWEGGHHPNWTTMDDRIVMNLTLRQPGRFVRTCTRYANYAGRVFGLKALARPSRLGFFTFLHDGKGLQQVAVGRPGSGHPTIHVSGNFLLSDAYPDEAISRGDGTVPIRWIDLRSGYETEIARVYVNPSFLGRRKELRVDPHPAWDRSQTKIAFNALEDGFRRVIVADLSQLLDG